MVERRKRRPSIKLHSALTREMKEKKPTPETGSWFPFVWTYEWLTPLIAKAGFRGLKMTDLYDLEETHKARSLVAKFDKIWEANEKKNLLRCFFKLVIGRVLWGISIQIIADLGLVCIPLIMQQILLFIQDESAEWYEGYLWVVGLFFIQSLSQLMTEREYYISRRIGLDLRSILSAKTYSKALNLSNKARRRRNFGEITNLMSIDCLKIENVWRFLLQGASGGIQITISLILLTWFLGWSVVIGFLVVSLLVPVQVILAKILEHYRTNVLMFSDARIKGMTELIQGIQVLKFFSWEDSFESKILEIRKKEAHNILISEYLRNAAITFLTITPIMLSVSSFVAYYLLGNPLTAEVIFPSLAYFNSIALPMSLSPIVVGLSVEALVSLNRLEEFLREEELPDLKDDGISDTPISIKNCHFKWEMDDDDKIKKKKDDDDHDDDHDNDGDEKIETIVSQEEVEQAKNEKELIDMTITKKGERKSVAHLSLTIPPTKPTTSQRFEEKFSPLDDESSDEDIAGKKEKIKMDRNSGKATTSTTTKAFEIKNLSFEVKQGDLLGIAGAVGSGKSSLIHAILGEMTLKSGERKISGSIAYCPQKAWVMNATVIDNIIFGLPFVKAKFDKIVKICCLAKDFEKFDNGPYTEIGEKGTNLSGGQKQRISIARAVYADADIYLFDDPLSAVDDYVGKVIFQKCILSHLAKKTRVLISHHLQYLKFSNNILMMNNKGEVDSYGNFNAHTKKKSLFYRTMKKHSVSSIERQRKLSMILQAKEISKIKIDNLSGKTVAKEEMKTGRIATKDILYYLKGGGGPLVAMIMFCFYLVAQAGLSLTDWWIYIWIQETFKIDEIYYLVIYTSIGIGGALLLSLRNMCSSIVLLRCGNNLHDVALHSLLYAPMSFYQANPTGRMIARFSKDLAVVDSLLIWGILHFFNIGFKVLATFVIVIIIMPVFCVPVVVLMILFFGIQQFYNFTARQLKRLDGFSRSPLFSHFTESIHGISTIRSYRKKDQFILGNLELLDNNLTCNFLFYASQRWLGVRLGFIASTLLFAAGLLALISKDVHIPLLASVSPGALGLSLTYILQINTYLSFMVQEGSDAESDFTSGERLIYYCNDIPHERKHVIPELDPPKEEEWPQTGNIEFKNYKLRYRNGLPLVLKGVNLTIKDGESIGVCGRTGAGKSTLLLGIFRILEAAEGSINIDGRNIARIGLRALRTKISIIPQEPVLFSGTVRFNLDPFSQATDEKIWHALEKSNLRTKISELPLKLDELVNEGGSNFSVGERQLFCLARTLLKKSKILLLDEATASVDLDTDKFIQETIKTEFKDCTIITIAHRLNTIIDYDKILVMKEGVVSEFDTPLKLISNRSSDFYAMVKESGTSGMLINMAKLGKSTRPRKLSMLRLADDGPIPIPNRKLSMLRRADDGPMPIPRKLSRFTAEPSVKLKKKKEEKKEDPGQAKSSTQ